MNQASPTLGDDIDGRSLLPLIAGNADDDRDEAICEYAAECASHPVFMIRRGRYKYIHCEVDPPLLYDLIDDPDEQTNLAGRSSAPECRQRIRRRGQRAMGLGENQAGRDRDPENSAGQSITLWSRENAHPGTSARQGTPPRNTCGATWMLRKPTFAAGFRRWNASSGLAAGWQRRTWHPDIPVVIDDDGLSQSVGLVHGAGKNDIASRSSSRFGLIRITSVNSQFGLPAPRPSTSEMTPVMGLSRYV